MDLVGTLFDDFFCRIIDTYNIGMTSSLPTCKSRKDVRHNLLALILFHKAPSPNDYNPDIILLFMKESAFMRKRILVAAIMIGVPNFSYANDCNDANMKTQRLKKDSIILFTDVMDKDFENDTALLIQQYEKLTHGLKGVRELADISEKTLKYCAGKGFTNEIYSLKNKERVMFSVAFAPDFKVFYDKYLVPNNTWTEAAIAFESDIISKRNEIKVNIKDAAEQSLKKESERKYAAEAEEKELVELKGLLDKAERAKRENDREYKSKKHTKLYSADPNTRVKHGFDTFSSESKLVTKALDCSTPKITPASGNWGALYGCIQGRAETVKWFINEKAGTDKVANIKLMWNDWSKDVGYGIHADKREAQRALDVLINMYAPTESQLLNDVFWKNTNRTIKSNGFTFDYKYTKGPTIDERLIVVSAR